MTRAYKQKPLDRLFHVQQQPQAKRDDKAADKAKKHAKTYRALERAAAEIAASRAASRRDLTDFWSGPDPSLRFFDIEAMSVDPARGRDQTGIRVITIDSLSQITDSDNADFRQLEERVRTAMAREIDRRLGVDEDTLLYGSRRRTGRVSASSPALRQIANYPIQAQVAEMQESVRRFAQSLSDALPTAAQLAQSMGRAAQLMRETMLRPSDAFQHAAAEARIQMQLEELRWRPMRMELSDISADHLRMAFGFDSARVRFPGDGSGVKPAPDAPPHPQTGMVVHRPLRTMGGMRVEGVMQADGTVKYRPASETRQFTRSAIKGKP